MNCPSEYSHWMASPINAPIEFLKKLPSIHIMTMGEDILKPEGWEFARTASEHSRMPVEIKNHPGCPHHAFSMGKLFPHLSLEFKDKVNHCFKMAESPTEHGVTFRLAS